MPPGHSVRDNVRYIEGILDLYSSDPSTGTQIATSIWVNRVREGGLWDYKLLGPKYEAFGNYNYGATGRALFSGEQLQRAAGAVQWLTGPRNASSYPWGAPPYGDWPKDQFWIKQGIQYYDQGKWR